MECKNMGVLCIESHRTLVIPKYTESSLSHNYGDISLGRINDCTTSWTDCCLPFIMGVEATCWH